MVQVGTVVLILAVLLLFQRELRTLGTLERVGDTSLFIMEYIGDYGFDDFLETGASSDPELIRFIAGKLFFFVREYARVHQENQGA